MSAPMTRVTLALLVLAGCDPAAQKPGDPCPADADAFERLVWQPVLASPCATCHVPDGQAAATRLVFTGDLAHDAEVAAVVAREDAAGTSLLLAKPLGLVSHGGGTLIAEGSTQAEALRFWVEWSRGERTCDAPDAIACTAEGPGARQVRRLTPEELDNTIADLLDVDADTESLAADDVVGPFANNAAALDVSGLLADQLRALAEEVAWSANLQAMLPCDPETDGQAPCAALFIEDFGLRAWRRPLTQDDVDRYVALWEDAATDEGFLEGLRWVVAAMLQSPHFLYRMELGERDGDGYRLTGWELATELSYLYWRTTPDAELLAAAADGSLDTAEGRAAQVARLRADARAAETVADFVDAWLQLDDLDLVTRDAATYPAFSADIRAAMRGETRRLVQDVATDGTLGELFEARHTWLTPELAAYYGVDAPGTVGQDGYGRVELDGDTYGGLLTQGSLLATWALPTTSSPVHRGVLVRERILCQDLPPPPANLDTSPPPMDASLSTRERYGDHAAVPACAACHDLIDPIGFGLEHYDGVGRWRETDGEHTIDASGEIVGSPHTTATFDGAMALGALLGRSPDVQACYARMWTVWGTGVADTESLTCAAESLAGDAAAGDLPLLAPRDALVSLEHFARRTGGAEEGDTFAAGDRVDDLVLPADDGPWSEVPWEETVTWSEETSDWGTGYCTTLTVTNVSDEAVDWVVRTDVPGTVSSSWCVTMTEDGDAWNLSGSSGCGNVTLDPGASTSAGWCGTN